MITNSLQYRTMLSRQIDFTKALRELERNAIKGDIAGQAKIYAIKSHIQHSDASLRQYEESIPRSTKGGGNYESAQLINMFTYGCAYFIKREDGTKEVIDPLNVRYSWVDGNPYFFINNSLTEIKVETHENTYQTISNHPGPVDGLPK